MYGGAPYGKVPYGDILHDTEAISGVDTAVGTDSIGAISRQYSDSASGSETAVINITVIDVGIGTEPQEIVSQKAFDFAFGFETASLTISIMDSANGQDLAYPFVMNFVPPTAAAIISQPYPSTGLVIGTN